MAQTRLIYSLWGDNKAVNVTPTLVSGTAITGYEVTYVSGVNPAHRMMLNETTCRIQWNMTTATRLDWLAIVNHNLDAGLSGVKIEANTSASWGSPPLSQAITIPGVDADNYHLDAWLDLTGISSRTYQYWSLAVTVANSAALKIGPVGLIDTMRALPANINWPVDLEDERPLIEHKTPYGVSYPYDSGIRVRRLEADVDNTDANQETVRQWWLEVRGRARPFFIVPDPAVNDALLVRFQDTKFKRRWSVTDRNVSTLAFEQLSRGIAA